MVNSTGTINRFRADGIVVVEYLGSGVTRTGTSGSDTYEITSVGTITYAYRATDTTLYLSDPRPNGTVTTRVNGRVISQGPMTGVGAPALHLFRHHAEVLQQHVEHRSFPTEQVHIVVRPQDAADAGHRGTACVRRA